MLITTLRCSTACKHCCLACSPEKTHLSISEVKMLAYIKQAYDYGIRSVVFNGGEPTLLDLSAPMLLAKSFGLYIDVRTNAYWATDYNKAIQSLENFQQQGLDRLGLSYDKYHAETIPYQCVVNALEASRKLHLQVYLDWIGLETREQIQDYLHLAPEELRYVGPPLKKGRAAKLSEEHFVRLPIKSLEKGMKCSEGLPYTLTIFPGGYASLHPCCWVNTVLIRKIGTNGWIKGLEDEMKDSPMVTFLRDRGIPGLIEKAKSERPDLLKPYYSHPCEACYDLLGPLFPAETQELPYYLEELRSQNLA